MRGIILVVAKILPSIRIPLRHLAVRDVKVMIRDIAVRHQMPPVRNFIQRKGGYVVVSGPLTVRVGRLGLGIINVSNTLICDT